MPDEPTESPQILERLEKILRRNFNEVMEELALMQTSAFAIIAAAYLDEQLKELLKDFFIDKKKITNQMLEEKGPISTFASRIDLAFLLGLISEREHRMLGLIRKIRNEFAHNSEKMSFSHPAIQNRCREFGVEELPWQKKQQNIAAFANEILTVDYYLAMHKFDRAYEFLLLVIGYRREQIKRRDVAEPITEDELHSILKARGLFARKSKQTTNPTEQNPG